MQAEIVSRSARTPARQTRQVGTEEFVRLLISRQELERDLRAPGRLVCRETGTVYVLEDEAD